MITPAVMITACASLIFSTANRLGRIFDRVNLLKAEVEGVLAGKLLFPTERMESLKTQLQIQRIRAILIQRSMAFLYTATSLFVLSSLGFAFSRALFPEYSWFATLTALLGGIFLFIASIFLLYESRYNLKFIKGLIDLTEFLGSKIPDSNSPR
ncbi:hypothetical protein A0128_12865 [Leptospira tipperaryensis]|uniref:DUF2721 domain-containing protein n=1 Tax=Leptospira tipperaryensis TaxID=2564040 RepID=A0A1D7UYM2_9LEPT|nr:DUF2721 domain-containing protein [Leptospira tipperaryensis]AOP34665.1 hypothetical protein A0128_12865 [Leptospira tipperaryensis]